MNAMHHHMGDIFPEKKGLIRYSNLDFIGPLSLETVLNGSNYVMDAKGLEISAAETKCTCKAYWWCKFLMYGE